MSEKYILRVSAGPGYDEAAHVEIPVNSPEPVRITSEAAIIDLTVRIRDYNGLPSGSPSSSPYFSTEPHAGNLDQYSISFRFTPLEPPSQNGHLDLGMDNDDDDDDDTPRGISAADLMFGNDFDRPIRDRLPPGASYAFNILKWFIDPGLEGDIYADQPYLYGPALSSFNVVSVGGSIHDEKRGGLWIEEGGDEAGMATRSAIGAPREAKARMKWALQHASKKDWIWEYGKTYGIDFFNPYLDFANLGVKLPGFRLSAVKHLEKRPRGCAMRRSHHLRYVLRHRTTGQVYLVVMISLYLKEDVAEDGTIRWTNGMEGLPTPPEDVAVVIPDDDDGGPAGDTLSDDQAFLKAMEKLGSVNDEVQTQPDDVN